MSLDPYNPWRQGPYLGARYDEVVASPAEAPPPQPVEPPPRHSNYQRKWFGPLLLYVLTCISTYAAYRWLHEGTPGESLLYAGALMLMLTAHEMGHFVQTLRYGVHASFPIFLPMPSIIGTLGAVIRMRGYIGSRKALFDIGISGPLAGLVPAMVYTVVGLHLSHFQPVRPNPNVLSFGAPPVIEFLAVLIKGNPPAGQALELHPLLFAGWVGMLLTSLNLFPIGQLDGGHILYALLRRRSYPVAEVVLLAAVAAVVWFGLWIWTLMLGLLVLMGPRHPPTADDDMPLGTGRIVLGLLTLLFPVIGFTPMPFVQ